MPEYTPTTDEVREDFAFPWDGFKQDREARLEAFDRWLADHDKEVAARALEDLAAEGEAFMKGAGYEKPADDDWNVAPRWYEIRRLRAHAAYIRSGSEGDNR